MMPPAALDVRPNALSFDVEEHFQVHNFAGAVARRDWDRFPSRVVSNTRRILHVLGEFQARATFFVLGWVAERHPELVEEIAVAGHEVASHGFQHRLVYDQTPREFAADLDAAQSAIWSALGVSPSRTGDCRLGYRAPGFSITPRSSWALPILAERGYRYDSSVSPTTINPRSRNPGSPRFAHRAASGLWEFPVSTLSLAGVNLPVAGGGYFRLAPLFVTRTAIRHLNRVGQPAVLYLHPWEFDPAQPRIPGTGRLARFRHYVNLEKTASRLRELLQCFSFGPLREVFASELGAGLASR